MSRFSSLDAQSSALITLERQRLESKIGQLRREVESPGDVGPRRLEKKVPSKGQRSKVAFPPQNVGAHHEVAFPPQSAGSKSAKNNPDANGVPGPDEESSAEPGSAEPSCKIAWLMQVSELMEAEGAEAKAFLAKHGLDRYCTLLAEKGLDSLKALRHAPEADLVEVGLPEAMRQKLIAAIASLPPDSGSQPHAPDVTWHRFGKAPPGWRSVEDDLPFRNTSKGSASVSVATKQDMACGDDDPIEASWLTGEPTDDPTLPLEIDRQEVTVPDSESDAANVRFFNVEGAAGRQLSGSLDSSKALPDVPEESEKVCCYSCFKQVWSSHAVKVEDPIISGPRLFCTDACSSSFRKELEVRAARETQRSSLWQAVPTQDAKEASSRPGSAASKAAAATETAIGRSLTRLNDVPDFEPSSRPGSSANISANAAATALGRPLSAALRPPSGRPPSGYPG